MFAAVLGALVVLLSSATTAAKLIVEDAEDTDNGRLLISVAKLFTKQASCLVLITSDEKFILDLYTYNSYYLKTAVLLYRPDTEMGTRNEVEKQYLVAHYDAAETERILIRIRSRVRTHTRIVILLRVMTDCAESVYSDVFSVAWSRLRLKNVIVICDDRRVYTYDPFLDHVDGFDIDEIARIKGSLTLKNYHGRVISASLFESVPTTVKVNGAYIGIDPMVMRTIGEALNATIVHHEPRDNRQYGFRLDNGSTGGAIKELYSKEIDVAFNQVFVKEYNAPELDFSKVIYRDSLCVVVPKAGFVPSWTVMFYTFPVQVWLMMLVVLAVVLVGLVLIRKLRAVVTRYSDSEAANRGRRRERDCDTVFVDVSQIFFSAAYHRSFSDQYYERLFLGVIFIYCLTMNTLFQSSLVTVMTSQMRYSDINTLKDLARSGYYISTSSPSLADTFNGTRSSYVQALNGRFRIISQNDSYFEAYVTRESKQNYLVYLKDASALGTHIVRECPRTFLLAYLTYKDAYFREDFDEIIERIMAAGLVRRWYDTVLRNVSLTNARCELERNGTAPSQGGTVTFPRPFTVQDLQTSFYILIAGSLGALLVFCAEAASLKFPRAANFAPHFGRSFGRESDGDVTG